MARNLYRIFTENNPVMGDGKTFGIPEAKGLNSNFEMFQLNATVKGTISSRITGHGIGALVLTQ